MKFIHKNGHVIPIRDNQAKAKSYARGAGVAILANQVAITGAHIVDKSEKPIGLKKFGLRHADLVKKAGYPKIVLDETIKGAQGYAKTGGFNRGKASIVIGPKAPESTILHELGHIAASRDKFSASRLVRKTSISVGRLTNNSSKMKLAKGFAAGVGFAAIKPALSPIIEAEASAHAIRAASKYGAKKALKIGARLALPYASHVAGSASTLLLAAAAVSYVRNRKKK